MLNCVLPLIFCEAKLRAPYLGGFLAPSSLFSHEITVKMTAMATIIGDLTGTEGSDFMVGKLVLVIGRCSSLPHGLLQRTACVLTG